MVSLLQDLKIYLFSLQGRQKRFKQWRLHYLMENYSKTLIDL